MPKKSKFAQDYEKLAPKIKERPKMRKFIVRNGLQPRILADGTWDRCSALAPGRATPVYLGEGLQRQMRKMIGEGYWK